MVNIVIAGGGFAGLAAARRLEKILRPHEAVVTLISRENFQLFTPMLPEVSSGGLETRHVVTPLRPQLKRTQFVLGEISAIDVVARTVTYEHIIRATSATLSYDHLVLALGSVTSTFGIDGVADHTLPFKTIEDAERLRNRVIATLELADIEPDPAERKRLLTYAVVGGGYTGVEVAGELVDFFRSIARYYRTIDVREIEIVLIEGGPKLLGDLPAKMGVYSARHLARRGLRIILGDLVAGVDAAGVRLKSGVRVESSTVVWSAGVRPSPLVAALSLEHARNGGILTADDMSALGATGVWALGDNAWIPDGKGGFYPATAQHALREGPLVAANIVATIRATATKPFRFTALGTMASLGGRRGVAALPGNVVITGFIAWVLWRTYYLSRIIGFDRKARVGFDWFIGLLFPRDIAEQRVYSDRARAAALADAGRKD